MYRGRHGGRGNAGRRGGGGGRGRGLIHAGMRPVSESTRINIKEMLLEFRQSDETEMKFPPNLDNDDRAVVHSECKKYGFTSKSYGKGESRQVTVRKPQRKSLVSSQELAPTLPLSPHSISVLQNFIQAYPPSEAELAWAAEGGEIEAEKDHHEHQNGQRRNNKAGKNPLDSSNPEELKAKAAKCEQRRTATPAAVQVQAQRQKLPISEFRTHILDAMNQNQVVMVAGETGCGKTTQVPQYILDESWQSGRPCKMICTQPRRISAMTVSERVAQERGEPVGGGTVGYQIRLESKGSRDSPLMFCTNGVLLRKLASSQAHQELAQLSHIVMDEIHERDKFADFLLILLRDLLPRHPHLKLVLMSATLNEDVFANYFPACPVVRVPGRMFPVEELYLEDVLGLVGYWGGEDEDPAETSPSLSSALTLDSPQRQAVADAIQGAFLGGTEQHFHQLLGAISAVECEMGGGGGAGGVRSPLVDVQHPATGATALMVAAAKGRQDMVDECLGRGANLLLRSKDGSTAAEWAGRFNQVEIQSTLTQMLDQQRSVRRAAARDLALAEYLRSTNTDEVDLNLVATLIRHVTAKMDSGELPWGAVLVFLPGWDDISRLRHQLETEGDQRKRLLLPLHSMLPPQEQKKVFQPAPKGVHKVVLSTNIAETAVTIEDVVFVINGGRLKEKSYDPFMGVATLQQEWACAASQRQRRGRAGRVRPGVCFHLFSRTRSSSLVDFQLPELLRSPLEELCLQVKLLEGHGSIAQFLSRAIEPPPPQAVNHAIQLLRRIGALTPENQEGGCGEGLTRLGRHLAALPLPPQAGKLLLYAALFGVLDPLLTVAAAQASRSPFVSPMDPGLRQAADRAKASLAIQRGGGSDHLALIAAMEGWERAKGSGGEWRYCSSMHLSPGACLTLHGLRGQLAREMQGRGLIRDVQSASVNSGNSALVRAVLVAGFYPQIGVLTAPQPGSGASAPRSLKQASGQKVRIAPGSVSFEKADAKGGGGGRRGLGMGGGEGGRGDEDEELVVVGFEEATRGESNLVTREVTLSSVHPALLVSGRLTLQDYQQEQQQQEEEEEEPQPPTHALMTLDEWLPLLTPLVAAAPLCSLRGRLASCLSALVHHPTKPLQPQLQAALSAIAQILTIEGGGGFQLAIQAGAGVLGGGGGGGGGGINRNAPSFSSAQRPQYSGGGGMRSTATAAVAVARPPGLHMNPLHPHPDLGAGPDPKRPCVPAQGGPARRGNTAPLFCDLCQVSATDANSLAQHLAGKQHRRRAAAGERTVLAGTTGIRPADTTASMQILTIETSQKGRNVVSGPQSSTKAAGVVEVVPTQTVNTHTRFQGGSNKQQRHTGGHSNTSQSNSREESRCVGTQQIGGGDSNFSVQRDTPSGGQTSRVAVPFIQGDGSDRMFQLGMEPNIGGGSGNRDQLAQQRVFASGLNRMHGRGNQGSANRPFRRGGSSRGRGSKNNT